MVKMKPGDIIIFQAGDNWLSKCIAKLTDSNVSHAAIRYADENMIEMTKAGIQKNGCYQSESGECAYLLRLSPEKDMNPVLEAANKYLNAQVRYDFPDLVFFAGLLIYRKVRPTKQWQELTDIILNVACEWLDKVIDRIISKGNPAPAMVCSQLVYQCYLDGGDDYKIILKDPLLQKANLNVNVSSGNICLADIIQISENEDIDNATAHHVNVSEQVNNFDIEEIAKKMYDAMTDINSETVEIMALNGTINNAKRFLDSLNKLLEMINVNIPVPALFVAPSDLLYHTENLKQYATTKIDRET